MPDLTSVEGQEPLSHTARDLLKRYRGRIESSKKWREDECHDKTWKRLRDMYRLKMIPEYLNDGDQIAVAISFATINVIAPSVSINHPKFTVTSKKYEQYDNGTIAEAVLNYWWKEYDCQPGFRRAVKDALIFGHGWLKVGWRYEEKDVDRTPEEMQAEFDELNQQLDQDAGENPDTAHLLPSPDDIQAQIPTHEPKVTKDHPYVERVSPFDMYVDPEATGQHDWEWSAQRVVRVLEEAKKDKRYNAKVRNKLQSDGSVAWQQEGSRYFVKDDVERVTIWEFYDYRRQTISVFSDQGDGFLVDPEDLEYTFNTPYVMISNYEVPDQFYPIGDLEAIEPLNLELNQARSQQANDRKAYKRKYLYRKSAFQDEGLDALTDDSDNTLVPVNDDAPLGEVIVPMPNANPNPELYQQSEQIENDIDRVSGISEYQRGGMPEIRRTATEASIIQDAANARSDDKLAIVEGALRECGRKLIQLAQSYMTEEQVIRITGQTGQQAYFSFTPEDIEGEFDFDVEAGSTQPQNETFRRQQATQILNTLGPFIGTVIDPNAFLTHVMREGFGIKNPEQFMIPPEVQMAQQQAAEEAENPSEEAPPGENGNNAGGGALGPGGA
jgi:hypothetical protein